MRSIIVEIELCKLQTKSKGVVDKVEGEKKEEEDKPDKDAETTTEGEEEVKEEVSSDERCTSEEPEEHRVVVQVSPSQDDQLRAEKDKSASPELAKEEVSDSLHMTLGCRHWCNIEETLTERRAVFSSAGG